MVICDGVYLFPIAAAKTNEQTNKQKTTKKKLGT